MWLFDILRRRRYERRYRAARTILLGQYTYSRLSTGQQEAVRERDIQFWTACGVANASVFRRLPRRFFGSYVVAMKSLGIAPAVGNESWDVPAYVEMSAVAPKDAVRLGVRDGSDVGRYCFKLLRDYRFRDPATEEARRDLIALGADIPPVDAVDPEEVHHLTRDGRVVTWRQWMRKQWPAE
jgi:hypothetical protein